MEISEILKPNTLQLNSSIQKIQEKSNKFQHMLTKSLEADAEKPANVINKDKKPIDKKLMNTCIEMESIFVSKMMKEMRNTLPKEKLIDGGFAEKIFEDMLYDEYSLNLSKVSNLGLGQMLYNELSRK